HRIGRTGRAGNSGEAVSLVCLDEEGFMQDIERFTKQNIEKVIVPGFEAEAGEKAEPLAMGRQTIWGGLGKPPSRDVMQAAAKAARSEMMTRIRDTKGAQPARGGNAGAGGRGGRAPAGGGNAGAGRGGNGGGFGGNASGNSERRAPAQPRQNAGYSQGGQPSGQPRNAYAQAPRQRDSEPRNNDFDNQQPASHASSGFPSSGQPTGNRNNFRGGNRTGGGAGGAGGRSNGPRRSGGPGSFTGR
ncbi:MAG: RNA helicase, partial [Polaromonas sp.]